MLRHEDIVERATDEEGDEAPVDVVGEDEGDDDPRPDGGHVAMHRLPVRSPRRRHQNQGTTARLLKIHHRRPQTG